MSEKGARFILGWLIAVSAALPVCAAEISLFTDTPLATEGYFVLSWESEEDPASEVRLYQSESSLFTSEKEYLLPANSSLTITGLENSEYFFRVVQNGLTSETLVVSVEHHDLGRALVVFSIGLLLFVILTCTIVAGNRSLGVTEQGAADAS